MSEIGTKEGVAVMPKWKREHLSFIKNIRQIGNNSPLPSSMSRDEGSAARSSAKKSYLNDKTLETIEFLDDLVICPHCQRKFS